MEGRVGAIIDKVASRWARRTFGEGCFGSVGTSATCKAHARVLEVFAEVLAYVALVGASVVRGVGADEVLALIACFTLGDVGEPRNVLVEVVVRVVRATRGAE